MRFIVAALLAVSTPVLAQSDTDKPVAKDGKKDDKPADAKAKARPRVILKKDGAGEDAGGGGAHTGPSSRGGTPSTPSGSFTR
jgi:hypothetical protein